jgi:hypothetical protein
MWAYETSYQFCKKIRHPIPKTHAGLGALFRPRTAVTPSVDLTRPELSSIASDAHLTALDPKPYGVVKQVDHTHLQSTSNRDADPLIRGLVLPEEERSSAGPRWILRNITQHSESTKSSVRACQDPPAMCHWLGKSPASPIRENQVGHHPPATARSLWLDHEASQDVRRKTRNKTAIKHPQTT